jgi:hypothetical protein
VREEYGRTGLARVARLAEGAAAPADRSPFARMRDLHYALQSDIAAPRLPSP